MAGIAVACLVAAEQIWVLIVGDQSWRPDVRQYEPLPDQNGHRSWKEVYKHGALLHLNGGI
jgi:hypothetical protein